MNDMFGTVVFILGVAFLASMAHADDNKIIVADEETGRKIVLGKHFSPQFAREVFGMHFLDSDGSHDMMLDADDGVSSVRLYADNEEKIAVAAVPDAPVLLLRHEGSHLLVVANSEGIVTYTGSESCLDEKPDGKSNRCHFVFHTDKGRTGSVIFENGEASLAYIVESDGSLTTIPRNNSSSMSNSDIISGVGVAIQGYCAVFGCN